MSRVHITISRATLPAPLAPAAWQRRRRPAQAGSASGWIPGVLAPFGQAKIASNPAVVDPLVLDLDGDGIELTSLASSIAVQCVVAKPADRDGTGGAYTPVQIALIEGVADLAADDLLSGGYLIAA